MDLRILAMCAVLLADQSAVAFLRAPGHTGARPPPVRTPCPARWERIDGAPPAPRRALTPHRSALRAHERKPIGVGGGELQRLSDVPFRLGMPAREVRSLLRHVFYKANPRPETRSARVSCRPQRSHLTSRPSPPIRAAGAHAGVRLAAAGLQRGASSRPTISRHLLPGRSEQGESWATAASDGRGNPLERESARATW